MEISFKPDTGLYDGRYANIGWLQETPRQVTSMAWDNAAIMSLDTMSALGLDENNIVELNLNGRIVKAGALMVPGHPDNAITVHLGNGHRSGGRVAAGVGFNAYLLRTSDAPYYAANLSAKKVDGTYDLCVTKVHNIEHRDGFAQHDLEKPESDKDGVYSLAGHEAMERAIIRYATLDEVKANPKFAHEGGASGTLINKDGYWLYLPGEDEKPDDSRSRFCLDAMGTTSTAGSLRSGGATIQNAWGMAIDLNSCVGCNACIVSCYAENNIPVVGREQVKIGRNMQWIRIDTYFEGDLHAPKAQFQPMTASTGRTQAASRSARWAPRCIHRKASTRWCTTVAWARGTARTTARTRCAGSTSCSTAMRTTVRRSRSSCAIQMSRCVRAA